MKYLSTIFLLFTLNAKINEKEVIGDIESQFGEQLRENNLSVQAVKTGEEKINKKSTDIFFDVTLVDN